LGHAAAKVRIVNMFSRRIAEMTFALIALAASGSLALAQQQPAAPAAPGAAGSADDPNNQFSINQMIGDWVVRCILTTIKSPAPCDLMQATINKDNNTRISSFSIAYVPSREAYAVQIVVPTGVALAKGLNLAAGDHSINGTRFNRCERDGCYVEMLIDPATVTALSGVGDATNIVIYGYGRDNEIKLPVSLKGFPEAMDRMKSYARTRAVALPPAAAPGAPAATAPARPAPGR
jgi:invasion protein IalB